MLVALRPAKSSQREDCHRSVIPFVGRDGARRRPRRVQRRNVGRVNRTSRAENICAARFTARTPYAASLSVVFISTPPRLRGDSLSIPPAGFIPFSPSFVTSQWATNQAQVKSAANSQNKSFTEIES